METQFCCTNSHNHLVTYVSRGSVYRHLSTEQLLMLYSHKKIWLLLFPSLTQNVRVKRKMLFLKTRVGKFIKDENATVCVLIHWTSLLTVFIVSDYYVYLSIFLI